MCLPKAPKQDPAIAAQQKEQKAEELARLREAKDKELVGTRRSLRLPGTRSLLSPGNSGSGFGQNYTA